MIFGRRAIERRLARLEGQLQGLAARPRPDTHSDEWRRRVEARLAALEDPRALRDRVAERVFAEQVRSGGDGDAPAAFEAADRFLAWRAALDYRSPIRTCEHEDARLDHSTRTLHCPTCGASFSEPRGLEPAARYQREIAEQAEADERLHRDSCRAALLTPAADPPGAPSGVALIVPNLPPGGKPGQVLRCDGEGGMRWSDPPADGRGS